MADSSKLPIDLIDKHIAEFRRMADNPTRATARRFYARGAFLAGLRDSLNTRLQIGWIWLEQHPDDVAHFDLWCSLLDRYQAINDLLGAYASEAMRESAASLIFEGVPYDARATP